MRASNNYLPPEQFEMLLQNIPYLHLRKWKSDQVAMLFKISYWCGLRIGETMRLHAEDFDLDYKWVQLGKTKTRKGDRATIPDLFLHELETYLDGKTGPLFDGINYPIVYHWLVRLGKKLDIPSLTAPQSETGEKTKTHIFRKSVGKDMIYGTVDGKRQPLNIVQKKLRHASLDMTSRYLQVGDDDVIASGW